MGTKGNYRNLFVIVFLILVLLVGCGARDKKKSRKLMGEINSFEKLPSDTEIGDFDWYTNGYVKLEQFKKYATKGKFSGQAIFSVPADFLSSTQAAKTDTWISGMTMSIDTLTKLKVTDWSLYKKFAVDIYVPDNKQRDFYIKIIDMTGKEHLSLRPIKSGRNKLEVLLEDVKTARIDLKNIVSFSLYMDTKAEEKDVTLFIDNVRLVP